MVWQNYGMVVGNKFYFHGGPLGLNWEVGSLTLMQKNSLRKSALFSRRIGSIDIRTERG